MVTVQHTGLNPIRKPSREVTSRDQNNDHKGAGLQPALHFSLAKRFSRIENEQFWGRPLMIQLQLFRHDLRHIFDR
jgi:hypothetical protein